MRKNAANVIGAFVLGQSKSDKTLSTDGEHVYSYSMLIAFRGENGNVYIRNKGESPSRTTSSHISAIRQAFPQAGEFSGTDFGIRKPVFAF